MAPCSGMANLVAKMRRKQDKTPFLWDTEQHSQTFWHFSANTLCRLRANKGFSSLSVTKAHFVSSAGSSLLVYSKFVSAGWFPRGSVRVETQIECGIANLKAQSYREKHLQWCARVLQDLWKHWKATVISKWFIYWYLPWQGGFQVRYQVGWPMLHSCM